MKANWKWLAGLMLATSVGIGLGWKLGQGGRAVGPAPETSTASVAAAESSPVAVTLPEAKQQAAHIETTPVQRREMRATRWVPGRVQYDDTRHVELKAGTDGVFVKVLVKPGDQVQTGQVLAVLSSPEVGSARADVLQRQAELELAGRTHTWRTETGEQVAKVIEAIDAGEPIAKIEGTFRNSRLGDYRGTLLAAYSKFLLATNLASKAAAAAEGGAVSNRTVSERTSERESAEELLRGALEQSLFDTRQAAEAAEADLQNATRRHEVAREHLENLLGYEEGVELAAAPGRLSLVELRAPFPGTIEEQVYGATERIVAGATQFVLADTTRLWVAADVREADWPALNLQPGQKLPVATPALPGKSLEAEVYYVGRAVEVASSAIPLVARLDNSAGLLRPGLFVRVSLPLEVGEEVLAVPEGAVLQHERERFVFVTQAEGRYRRVDVETGREGEGWIEVRSGLAEGDLVVSRGAFALKSELLLEREE